MFAQPTGLYALLGLLILLILYLRRPKPLQKIIPSLMFVIKEKGEQKRYSLFKKLISNILFFLQLLALAALGFAAAEPFINLSYDITTTNTVIVMDTSASMQTEDGLSTRFNKAIDEAKNHVSGRTSIVTATLVPAVLLAEGGRGEAKSILEALQPTDMPTNIEGAMFEAENLLKGETGKIVIISDFVVNEELDQPLKAKVILESKGHTVIFKDVGTEADNIGIIDLEVKNDGIKAFIKNFQEETATLTINLAQGSTIESRETTIEPDALEVLSFPLPTGTSTIELNHDDDLKIDNTAYVSAPTQKQTDVVLITSLKPGQAPSRSEQPEYINYDFITRALTSIADINLEIVRPPRMIVTASNKNVNELQPKAIILHKVNKDELISHAFADYEKLVSQGAAFIITAQRDLEDIDLEEMSPVTFRGIGEDTPVCVDVFNTFTNRFEENPCFTEMDLYVIADKKNSSLSLATARDESPVFALAEHGQGKVFYYGIFDDFATFKSQENYPIFWNNLLDFLTGSQDIATFNKRFTDEGMFKLEKTGFHDREEQRIALNLLDESESDINKKPEEFDAIELNGESGQTVSQFNLALPLALLALVLVLTEILVVKFRGDL